MSEWIVVHDAETVSKKRPYGKEIVVRAASVDTIRPYPPGRRALAVLGIHGSYLHVTEGRQEVLALIEESKKSEAGRG